MDENLPKDDNNKPEDTTPKKKSFRQKWNEWWRLTWESFIIEVQDRVLMSWKRIIKFCGIVLIPIIYGVICTVAFWNPIAKIGKSELIVMDNDISVLLVTDNKTETDDSDLKNSKTKSEYIFGTVSDFGQYDQDTIKTILTGRVHGDVTPIKKESLRDTKLDDNDIVFYSSQVASTGADKKDKWTIGIKESSNALRNDVERNRLTAGILRNFRAVCGNDNLTVNLTNGQSDTYDATNPGFSFQITSAWQILKGALLPKKDAQAADKDYTFATPIVNEQEQISLTNIKYSPDVDANKNNWTKNKGYMQAWIPDGYTADVLNYASVYLQKLNYDRTGDKENSKAQDDSLDDSLKNIVKQLSPVKFWTTFERNFLFGYLFTALSGSLGSTAAAELPGILNAGLVNNAQNYISIDGARFQELVSQGKTDKNHQISADKRYVISESSDFSKDATSGFALEELKSSSLFGDVNSDSTEPTVIGGKFINSMSNLFAAVDTAGIDDLGNLIGGDTWKNIKKAIDDIKKAIANGGKDKPNNNKPSEITSFVDKDDATYKAALIELNKNMYMITTGQLKTVPDSVNSTIAAVWKALKDNGIVDDDGKEAPKLSIEHAQMFMNGELYVDLDTFNTRFNRFLDDNPRLFLNAKTIDEILPSAVKKVGAKELMGLAVDKLFIYGIQGESAGIYGIGLGEFFLTIGLYVGCLLQTFIFDRAKRLNKSKWSNWYISKYMLMLGIVFFQVTAEMWVVYAVGWDQYVTPAGMTYAWLWMLFNGLVFVTIVQALWFIIKDESIGRFLCVLVLVFSLAAGGGTFPAYTQFKFFEVIGPIVPFTYTLQGLGEIVYGISQNNVFGISKSVSTPAQSLVVLQNWGYLWIYIAIFLPLGLLVGAKMRMKEMNYGSHYGYAVAGAMKALGQDTSKFQILKKVTKSGKKKFYYDWKSLPEEFMPELYFQCRKMYKFEGEFKWWTRKHHDFVQKPNYSDEDTVTRNE